jgi:hypothetical protein
MFTTLGATLSTRSAKLSGAGRAKLADGADVSSAAVIKAADRVFRPKLTANKFRTLRS